MHKLTKRLPFLSLIMLLAAFLSTATIAQGQPFSTGEPEQLISSETTPFMSPVWSPDGSHIAFTTSNHRGIWIAQENGEGLTRLSDDESAGYGFSWSSDGRSVAATTARQEDRRRLHAVKVFDLETETGQTISDYSRERTGIPQWTDLDQHIAVTRGETIELLESGKEPASRQRQMQDDAVIASRGNEVLLMDRADMEKQIVRQFDDRRITHMEPSPDGSKVAVHVLGRGIFVMNADGSGLQELGKGERPTWMPDTNHVLVMETEDDGYRVTGSEIYAVDIDSGERHPLTEHTDLIPLNPSVSPDGSRIAFHDGQSGVIYTMEIE